MTIALDTDRIPSPGTVITFDQLSWEDYELLRDETEGRNIRLPRTR